MKSSSDEEWRKKLTPEQYRIMREKGTEAPFTGSLLHNDKDGAYAYATCGNVALESNTTFDHNCG